MGGELHTDPHVVFFNSPDVMKIPNQRNATIGDMLTFAAQMNGKATAKKASAVISFCLVNISDLQPLSALPWQSRKWALPAWWEIQRIGISESLELLAPATPMPFGEKPAPAARIRQLCGLLGLHYNKVNNRTVITRKPMTVVKIFYQEQAAEHGSFDIEIDQNAKPTQLCELPAKSDA